MQSVNAIQIEMVSLQAPFGTFDFGPKKLPGPFEKRIPGKHLGS